VSTNARWDQDDVVSTIELLAKRWVIPIMASLWEGPLRRVDLRLELGGISDKVLTTMLKRLENSEVVSRKFFEAVPPRVEYELTAKGRSLALALTPIAEWAETDDQ
jgi:DNA-binding HxlR family transcriptional regulator